MAPKDTPTKGDSTKGAVKWMTSPEDHDFAAATSYLGLVISDPSVIASLVEEMRDATITHYKAKDLLRASQLALLDPSNKYVLSDLEKIKAGKDISPILLVLGSLGHHPLIIADGYHRVCASYYLDENTLIPVVSASSPCLPA